ncbi:MAG: DcaP family trimeric outer membrane transporter [Pseudomonadota bacterium]
MVREKTGIALRTALLAATCMTASPVLAQDSNVEDRLDRLESLVEELIERLDAQQGTTQEQQTEMQAQQDEMRAQAAAVLAATQELEARQAELAEQIAIPRLQEDKGFRVGNTTIAYNGYVKLDAISQRTSGGQLPNGSILRDFLIPVAIPVGGEASGFDTDFSARQTRFLFKTATDVGEEHTLNSHIELDFNVTEGGDERISNSFTPRIRQAFITYDNWLFGQAWSTFMDVGALPDSLDFIGVTPGTPFDRQPLIRWTKGGLQLAIEQPETTVTTPTGGRLEPGDDTLPDFVAKYNFTGDWGRISTAGILRTLRVSDDDFGTGTDSALGYGVALSGVLKIGQRDDFRFSTSVGSGLGRYIGLNIVNDAAIDLDGNLDPITTYAGFGAYRHYWSDKLRSNLGGAYFKADNPVLLTTDLVTDESWNVFGNLIWNPVPPLDFGVELLYAERMLEDGRSGNLQRVQFSTRYNF